MENHNMEDEIIGSLRGIKRAEVSPFLFTRIQNRLGNVVREKPIGVFSLLSLSLAFSMLIAVNVLAIGASGNVKGDKNIQAGYAPDNANFNIYQ